MTIGADCFDFLELDEATRGYMLEELSLDVKAGKITPSRLMSSDGVEVFPEKLRAAVESGTEQTLAASLTDQSLWGPRKYTGKELRLSEGEFNCLYMRGLSLRGLSEGTFSTLVMYRAKRVEERREGRKVSEGQEFSCEDVLHALRNRTNGIDTLGLLEPNSGLSLKRKS